MTKKYLIRVDDHAEDDFECDVYRLEVTAEPTHKLAVDFSIYFESDKTYTGAILSGFVKWDGCLEISGSFHLCDPEDTVILSKLIKSVYWAAEPLLASVDFKVEEVLNIREEIE